MRYSEPSQTSKLKLFTKLVKDFQPLTTSVRAPSWMYDSVQNTPLHATFNFCQIHFYCKMLHLFSVKERTLLMVQSEVYLGYVSQSPELFSKENSIIDLRQGSKNTSDSSLHLLVQSQQYKHQNNV